MNIFTNDDYRKIQAWLKANAIKDSDLTSVDDTIPEEDTLVLVQKINGILSNVKISIKNLLNSTLNKIIIDTIIANAVKVNNILTVTASNVKIDNEKGTTLQDIIDWTETIENIAKGWNIEYQAPSIDEPTVRAKYVLKDSKGVPKGDIIKVYKDSAVTNVYLGTTEDICNENTGEVTKKPIQNNNEALSIVYRLDTGKYSLVNVPIGIFIREAEFDKYRGLGITENGQVFIKLANDVESSNYLHFNDSGELSADGIENRILQDLGTIINSVAGDGTMWGQYKKEEGTKDSSTNEASRWGQYKQAEADRNERLNNLENKFEETEQEIIYDVSAHNNNAVFESLQALLSSSNLSILIPTSVRCGGMSIRFIHGSVPNSDNKYVQYRLMTTSFSTNKADWQGVDDEPTAGSDNVARSGGVYSAISAKVSELDDKINSFHEITDTLEYVKVEVDAENKILSSIDKNGNKKEYLPTDFENRLSVKGKDVLTDHQDISGLATKTEVDERIKVANNETYTEVLIDKEHKILESRDSHGDKTFHTNVKFTEKSEIGSSAFLEKNHPMLTHVITDIDGKIIEAITKTGEKLINGNCLISSDLKVKGRILNEEAFPEVIDCFGDSQTGGGYTSGITSWVNVLASKLDFTLNKNLSERTINNFGNGGDNCNEIAVRQGGIPLYVKPFTLKASSSDKTTVQLYTDTNETINRLGVIWNNFNPILINDIECYYDSNKQVYRKSSGSTDVVIERPLRVFTSWNSQKRNTIQIIMMGQNGGYSGNLESYFAFIDSMIENMGQNRRYIVASPYTLTLANQTNLDIDFIESMMSKKYGVHYLNMRKYMLDYGLIDNNLTETPEDIERKSQGKVSLQLEYEQQIHPNQYGMIAMANAFYNKLKELNYIK